MTLAPGTRVRVVRINGAGWACLMRPGDVGVVERVHLKAWACGDPLPSPAYTVRRESDGHREMMTAGELEPMED